MDFEQIIKKLEWLDEERRKDKSNLVSLEERINAANANFQGLQHQLKELSTDISKSKIILPRLDSIDQGMLKHKREAKQLVDNLDKQLESRLQDFEKVRRVEMGGVEASLTEMRKEFSTIAELKRNMQSRMEEEARLMRIVEELRSHMDTVRKAEEEFNRQYRLLEDGRRTDGKRITDALGEISSLRKRSDEQHDKLEIIANNVSKVQAQLDHFESEEMQRKKNQVKFMEEQALVQVERERTWKEWQVLLDNLGKQSVDIGNTLQNLDETHRTIINLQKTVQELAQKVERRLNEMAEVHRLSEERFRQEWATSQADQEKRWVNYTLMQDEQRGAVIRQNEKLLEKVTTMEDALQDVQDSAQLINDLTQKQLQGIISNLHEMVTEYDRNLGRNRK